MGEEPPGKRCGEERGRDGKENGRGYALAQAPKD